MLHGYGPGPRRAGTEQRTRLLDAGAVRDWFALAVTSAEETRELVDSLNVFPVPDSDTGTNVLLTLRSAADALALLPEGADVAQATRATADGAVRGARGNSGLLISQALAALADVSAEAPDPAGLQPVELVRVYEQIASSTWAAVSRPVAGTLLTVARDAAAAARSAMTGCELDAPATIADLAAAAALGAQESVVETAGLGHGPVDAGGAALMLLFTALSDALAPPEDDGAPAAYTEVARQMLTDLAAGGVSHTAEADGAGAPDFSTGEFEVMYLLEATAPQAAELRGQLEEIGDCVGVVGTPDALGVGLYQVHVHTDTPRAALPRRGRARQVCVHHLHPTALALATPWDAGDPPLPYASPSQAGVGHVVSFERLAARRGRRVASERDKSMRMHPSQQRFRSGASPGRRPSREDPGADRIGVIVCTRAPGLVEQLARTGAVVVLDPEREGIVRAAGDLGLSRVLVLPCDADSAARAHEAARYLAARAVPAIISGPAGTRSAVYSTRSAISGAASDPFPRGTQLLVCDTDDEARVLAAAVAVAGQTGGESLSELALRAGRAGADMRTLALSGPDAEPDAVADAISSLLRPDDELLTVILGRDALPDVGDLAAAATQRAGALVGDPGAVEVVIHAGGQARPDVLLAVE